MSLKLNISPEEIMASRTACDPQLLVLGNLAGFNVEDAKQ